MKKNNINRIKDNFAFLLEEIKAPVHFELSLINQFDDADDYEIISTNDKMPLYNLESEEKYDQWNHIFRIGATDNVYSRIYNGYREFISLIEREAPYSYSFVIIHIPLDEYSKIGFYDYFVETEYMQWQIDKKLLSYIDYLTEAFLYVYKDPHLIPYRDIILKAGNNYVSDILQFSTQEKNINIYNDINVLSSLRYENSENNGNLLICQNVDTIQKNLDVEFEKTILFSEYKKVRKLLEIAKDDVFLIGTTRHLFGFITKESLEKISDFIGFQIKIYGALNWSISKLDITSKQLLPLIHCKDSMYQYFQPKFNQYEFCDAVLKKFPEANTKKLLEIINNAIQQKHGTTVIFANNAAEEAKRLNAACFKITPQDSTDITQHLTSIDGAIIYDLKGICYAIGAILDGTTNGAEDISNGARHNSARRYKNINTSCFIIIVSEDGYITPLY